MAGNIFSGSKIELFTLDRCKLSAKEANRYFMYRYKYVKRERDKLWKREYNRQRWSSMYVYVVHVKDRGIESLCVWERKRMWERGGRETSEREKTKMNYCQTHQRRHTRIYAAVHHRFYWGPPGHRFRCIRCRYKYIGTSKVYMVLLLYTIFSIM